MKLNAFWLKETRRIPLVIVVPILLLAGCSSDAQSSPTATLPAGSELAPTATPFERQPAVATATPSLGATQTTHEPTPAAPSATPTIAPTPAIPTPVATPTPTPPPAVGTWTVLVYMVADNNLEAAGVEDLREMLSVDAGDSVNVVIQVDRGTPKNGNSDEGVGGLGDWVSTKRLEVDAGSFIEVQDLGEMNSGDPGTLTDFIVWGLDSYPADQNALVLWDHGSTVWGFGQDETNDNASLNLPEIRSALDEALSSPGMDKLDLIGFDACLMASVEVAYELSAFGDILVASEELEPGHGWDYTGIIQHLSVSPDSTNRLLAQAIADSFKAQADQFGEDAREEGYDYNQERQITLSTIDLSIIDELSASLDTIAIGLITALAQETSGRGATWIGIAEAVFESETYGAEPGDQGETVDLGLVLQGFRDRFPAMAAEIAIAEQQISDAVLYKTAGQNRARSTGISVHFPIGEAALSVGIEEYLRFGLASETAWAELLVAHQTIRDTSAPEFNTGTTAFGYDGFGNLILASENLQEDLAQVYAYFISDEVILGLLAVQPIGMGVYSIGWDNRWFALGNGEDWIFVSLLISEYLNETTGLGGIDIMFQPAGFDTPFPAVLMLEYDWVNDIGTVLAGC